MHTLNSFEFVGVASLRVRQLVDGCTPRVQWDGKKTVIARREAHAGAVIGPDMPGERQRLQTRDVVALSGV
jgi:DNA-directed RNA polymerase subunit K/omega